MKRVVLCLVVVLLIAAVAGGGCASSDPLKSDLDSVSAAVVEIRGLTPKEPVEYNFITTAQLRDLMGSEIEKEYPEQDVQTEQDVLVLLDLIPADQDLGAMLLDILTEQVAGFYDDDTGQLYVVTDKGAMGPMEKATLAHEYTHALQDQYFDLKSLPLDGDDSDAAVAALSLVEGDAVLTQSTYMMQKLTRQEVEAALQESQAEDMEKFEAAPAFVRENLLFPYVEGVNFVLDLGVWDGINRAYSDLPQSSEQILHPEKYQERDEPQDVAMPDLEAALGPGWRLLDTDVLGELNLRLYLEAFVPGAQAELAAAGWDGDRYAYLKDAQGNKTLVMRSVWDSDAEAKEFFAAYVTFVGQKSAGAWDLVLDKDTERQWKADNLSLYLGRNGSDVLVIIAPEPAVVQKVRAAFPDFSG